MTESQTSWKLTWRLVSLYDGELCTLTGMRAAKWLGGIIAGFTAVMMFALRVDRGGKDVDQAALHGLGWLSWCVAGLALFSLAPRWFDFQRPVTSLAGQRGISPKLLNLAPTVALARRLWLLIALPALSLAVLGLALTNDFRLLGARLALLPGVAFYGLVLALVLAGLMRWSADLSPRFARTWLLVFVLGPHAARELWPSTPSVVALFTWLLETLSGWGTLP